MSTSRTGESYTYEPGTFTVPERGNIRIEGCPPSIEDQLRRTSFEQTADNIFVKTQESLDDSDQEYRVVRVKVDGPVLYVDARDNVGIVSLTPRAKLRIDPKIDWDHIFDMLLAVHGRKRSVEYQGIPLSDFKSEDVDLEDFVADEAVIYLRHRPESTDVYGTPLKNGTDGERIINISPALVDCLDAYVGHNRHDVTDEFGREPLFTTSAGRVSTTTVRRDFYKLSRPCEYDPDCPHGRIVAECEATRNAEAASCPSSFSTHPLRKWAIMTQLDEGVPKELLSDRVDVSVPILDKHYDQRSEERKSRRRREVLEANMDQYAMTDGGRPVDDEGW